MGHCYSPDLDYKRQLGHEVTPFPLPLSASKQDIGASTYVATQYGHVHPATIVENVLRVSSAGRGGKLEKIRDRANEANRARGAGTQVYPRQAFLKKLREHRGEFRPATGAHTHTHMLICGPGCRVGVGAHPHAHAPARAVYHRC